MAYPNALQLSTSPDDEPDDPGEPHHHDASAPRLRQTSLASSSLVRALFFNGTTPGSVSQTGRQSLPELYPTIPVARPGLVQHNTFPFANSRLLGSSHYDSPYPPDIVTFASVEPLPRDRRCSATSWTASESTTGPTTPGAPDPHSLYEYENPHHPGKWLQYSTQAIPEHGVLDLGESGVTQMTWWAPQDGSVVAAASISPITHLPPANDSYFPSDEHDTINFTPTLAAVASEIHGLSCQSPPLQPFVSPALLQQVLSPHLHLLETPSHEMPPAYAGTRGLMDSFLPREEHATPPPAPEQVRKRAKSRSPVACTSPRSARVDVESSMAPATRIDQELNRPSVEAFLTSPNKLLAGERTVVLMTPSSNAKVYGSEKRRYLVPTPSIMLLGPAWFTTIRSTGDLIDHEVMPLRVQLAVSGKVEVVEPVPLEMTLASGRTLNGQYEAIADPIFAGRGVGRGLYSMCREGSDPLADQPAVATASIFERVGERERCIGNFTSRNMHFNVRTNGRKLKQPWDATPSRLSTESSESPLIAHGSMVTLFTRARAVTSSLRYLSAAGATGSFGTYDWQRMTGHGLASLPYDVRQLGDPDGQTLRPHSDLWDPFLIYLVDTSKSPGLGSPDSVRPFVEAPPAPAHAFPLDPDEPLAIRFNQPVVLQCVHSGAISPVMIIRESISFPDHSLAYGGGGRARSHPSAPGEGIGACVMALSKIAFEMYDPASATARCGDHIDLRGWPGCGNYLSASDDQRIVTVHYEQPRELAKVVEPVIPLSTSLQSLHAHSPDDRSTLPLGRPRAQSVVGLDCGAGVKRTPRRRSLVRGSPFATPEPLSTPPLTSPLSTPQWTQRIGHASTWTIGLAGVARYTFYIPPCSPLAPSASIDRVPTVWSCGLAAAEDLLDMPALETISDNELANILVFDGIDFAPCHWLWFGVTPATLTHVVSRHRMLVLPPPGVQILTSSDRGGFEVSVVRSDGVVFRQAIEGFGFGFSLV